MVAFLLWVQEVGSSNLPSPTATDRPASQAALVARPVAPVGIVGRDRRAWTLAEHPRARHGDGDQRDDCEREDHGCPAGVVVQATASSYAWRTVSPITSVLR